MFLQIGGGAAWPQDASGERVAAFEQTLRRANEANAFHLFLCKGESVTDRQE
jgi:hypothetical protein